MAFKEREDVGPSTVLVVMVPTRSPEESATPPPEEPSCAAAEPPSAMRSMVLVLNVKTPLTEPKTTVGKRADSTWAELRNCAPYEAITTGVPGVGGVWAIGMDGNDAGSGVSVVLLVTARNAKSYSPVPFGAVSVRTPTFARIHSGEMKMSAASYRPFAGVPDRIEQETPRSARRKYCAICAFVRITPLGSIKTPLPEMEWSPLPAGT